METEGEANVRQAFTALRKGKIIAVEEVDGIMQRDDYKTSACNTCPGLTQGCGTLLRPSQVVCDPDLTRFFAGKTSVASEKTAEITRALLNASKHNSRLHRYIESVHPNFFQEDSDPDVQGGSSAWSVKSGARTPVMAEGSTGHSDNSREPSPEE